MKTVNIYNKVKAVLFYILLLSFPPALLSSCSDFLDILPMNSTVLENYWKEKADVTGAVNGCYEALATEDVITRMGVWGELRSDNIVAGNNVPNHINEMLRENLLPTNDMCRWASLYNVINRCNIVCNYAPEVQAIDPNYTYNEMKATIAEMKTIRALCYFYLIRAFRDVPYTTKPSIADDQNYVIPATKFEDVLDSLITDLEGVKDDAQRRFEIEKVQNKSIYVPTANTSRITRWATYALLADLYLWKGDWDNVIKYCDMVIDYKAQVYNELLQADQINDIELYDGIPMIIEATVKGTKDVGNAYTSIFGNGNSFEGIFEIYYNGNTGQENNFISNYYGNRDNPIARLKAPEFLMENLSSNTNQLWQSSDCRAYESIASEGTSYAITKYVRQSANFSLRSTSNVTVSGDRRTRKDANWIIYRLSDVMLMKAEALIERSESDWPEAFKLINNVYKRGNNISPETTTGSLTYETYAISKDKMEDLLFEERQREFLFEGKRWFDLVRLARRDGKTERLSSNTIRKHSVDQNVIKIKLTDPNYIYFPYAKSELKVNPLLVQNPAFSNTEEGVLK